MKSYWGVLVSACLIVMAGLPCHLLAQEEPDYVVMVHADNPVTELQKKEVAKLFLKKVKEWKELKKTVEPVDLAADSPIRERFSQEVLERTMSAIKAYWHKEIFSGRGVPPVEKASDDDVLKFISEHVGAIGYASKAADLSAFPKVKTLTILEAEE